MLLLLIGTRTEMMKKRLQTRETAKESPNSVK